MAATNRDVVGDKYMKNDGVLATSDQEKHLAWKEHYQRLLSEELEWDKANLSVNCQHYCSILVLITNL